MEYTSAKQALQAAINITGCSTPTAFARLANVSQNAVWKLLNGSTKRANPETARKFEMATNGRIGLTQFLKQGATDEAQTNGKEASDTSDPGDHPGTGPSGSAVADTGPQPASVRQPAADSRHHAVPGTA